MLISLHIFVFIYFADESRGRGGGEIKSKNKWSVRDVNLADEQTTETLSCECSFSSSI